MPVYLQNKRQLKGFHWQTLKTSGAVIALYGGCGKISQTSLWIAAFVIGNVRAGIIILQFIPHTNRIKFL